MPMEIYHDKPAPTCPFLPSDDEKQLHVATVATEVTRWICKQIIENKWPVAMKAEINDFHQVKMTLTSFHAKPWTKIITIDPFAQISHINSQLCTLKARIGKLSPAKVYPENYRCSNIVFNKEITNKNAKVGDQAEWAKNSLHALLKHFKEVRQWKIDFHISTTQFDPPKAMNQPKFTIMQEKHIDDEPRFKHFVINAKTKWNDIQKVVDEIVQNEWVYRHGEVYARKNANFLIKKFKEEIDRITQLGQARQIKQTPTDNEPQPMSQEDKSPQEVPALSPTAEDSPSTSHKSTSTNPNDSSSEEESDPEFIQSLLDMSDAWLKKQQAKQQEHQNKQMEISDEINIDTISQPNPTKGPDEPSTEKTKTPDIDELHAELQIKMEVHSSTDEDDDKLVIDEDDIDHNNPPQRKLIKPKRKLVTPPNPSPKRCSPTQAQIDNLLKEAREIAPKPPVPAARKLPNQPAPWTIDKVWSTKPTPQPNIWSTSQPKPLEIDPWKSPMETPTIPTETPMASNRILDQLDDTRIVQLNIYDVNAYIPPPDNHVLSYLVELPSQLFKQNLQNAFMTNKTLRKDYKTTNWAKTNVTPSLKATLTPMWKTGKPPVKQPPQANPTSWTQQANPRPAMPAFANQIPQPIVPPRNPPPYQISGNPFQTNYPATVPGRVTLQQLAQAQQQQHNQMWAQLHHNQQQLQWTMQQVLMQSQTTPPGQPPM